MGLLSIYSLICHTEDFLDSWNFTARCVYFVFEFLKDFWISILILRIPFFRFNRFSVFEKGHSLYYYYLIINFRIFYCLQLMLKILIKIHCCLFIFLSNFSEIFLAGAIAEGFQARFFEFQDFERKFEVIYLWPFTYFTNSYYSHNFIKSFIIS